MAERQVMCAPVVSTKVTSTNTEPAASAVPVPPLSTIFETVPVLGDDVEIGACTTIDRGALDHTIIEDGAIIDNLVQIAHNCRIGQNTAIAGCTGLAGSTIIGANCTLAGGVGVVGHVEICDDVHVTGMTMVTRSITEPGSYSSGTPMSGTRQWKRNAVRFSQLDSIQQRLAALEGRR